MVYLGLTSNNGYASLNSFDSNKKGSSSPDLVDLDDDMECYVSSSGTKNKDNNQFLVSTTTQGDQGDSGSEDESTEKIRVGKDYQVVTPHWIPPEHRQAEQNLERALLAWSPNPAISQSKLDKYINASKEKYGYNTEQALGLLLWHKHDIDKAIQDLTNFSPFPDQWTEEDKVVFDQAFQFHGKSFRRIKQLMPNKSTPDLVKYYYGWKKTRAKTSLMDTQAKIVQLAREKDGYYEGSVTDILNPDPGSDRKYSSKVIKNSSEPPKGMVINHDDLVAMTTGPDPDHILESLDREIVSYKGTLQKNKQILSSLHTSPQEKANIQLYKILTETLATVNAEWSNEELNLGVQGIRTFGKNFSNIADVIGTKTEDQVKLFYVNHHSDLNLDTALMEYEARHGPTLIADVKMELDTKKDVATRWENNTCPLTETNSSETSLLSPTDIKNEENF